MCHWGIRSWSGFTIYQVTAHQRPVAVIRMVSLTSASVKASGWFLTDLSVAWISLSSWGSITHSNGSRQTSGHSSYSRAWSYRKPEVGGGPGEREGERGERHSRAQADWQEPLTQLYWSHTNQCCFFPLCWYGLLLSPATVLQNTE